MYKIVYTNVMRKSTKLMQKRGKDMSKLRDVIEMLATGTELPQKYLDHSLKGNYYGYRECHIEPDWLLVYKIDKGALLLTLTKTGTHSDLFI